MRRPITRALATLGSALAVVVVLAGPAAADPARPTNDRSQVLAIDPALTGVSAAVVGGDTFLQVTAQPGHVVTVMGYENEPYLRIDADGTVEQNRKSPAVSLNKSRYGNQIAPGADAKAPPEWERIGTGATYEWHDHRIHWMGHSRPPQLGNNSTGTILTWSVPIDVDGAAATIHGNLVRVAAPAALPWWIAAAVAGIAGALLLRRRPARITAQAFAVAAVALTVVAALTQRDIPAGTGRHPSSVIIAGLAAVVAIAAVVVKAELYQSALLDAAALIGAFWAWRNKGVIGHAVLPSSLTPFVQRGAVALAVAVFVVRLVQRLEPVVMSELRHRAKAPGPARAA